MQTELIRGVALRFGVRDENVAPHFVRLHADHAVRDFIRSAFEKPTSSWKTGARRLLRPWLSDYDVNGLLDIYPMHLCSAEQWRALVPGNFSHLLDIGAGDGTITETLRILARRVTATEASRAMRFRLRRRGFVVADDMEGALPDADLIALLNVLDRTSHPASLLRKIHSLSPPSATLLVSVPLPLRPHVQIAGTTVEPDELLFRTCGCYEDDAIELHRWLDQQGWAVQRWTRIPYLARGDARTPIAVLDAAVLVCTKA